MAKPRSKEKLTLTVTITQEIKNDIEKYLEDNPELTQRAIVIQALRGFFKIKKEVPAA